MAASNKRALLWREFAAQFCKDHSLKKWASAEHNALIARALISEGYCSQDRREDLNDLFRDIQASTASAFAQAIGMREEKKSGAPDYLKDL